MNLGLPEPADIGNASGSSSAPAAIPAGHPPVSNGGEAVCPFALIQAALDSSAGEGLSLPQPTAEEVPKPAVKQHKKPQQFTKHQLLDTAIPEGISLKEKALADGINDFTPDGEDSDEDKSGVEMSHRPGLMCPVSGMMTDGTAPADHAKPPMPSQQSFNNKQSAAKSSAGGSRASGSRGGGGSRASGSRGRSNASSKNRKKAGRVKRRTKRNITFSEWEADTYIPQIKLAWQLVLSMHTRSEIGTAFYTTFLNRSQELAHMFTSGAEALGPKFGEILDSIVASTDNPASMHEQLKALAPMHIKKGVKPEYLPGFGEALVDTLDETMKGKFTTEMRAAWEWLWTWISQSFIMSLEEASNEATILSQSWDMAMDNCPGNEFGELFFDVLFELAPNMGAIFNKPKQILSVKFCEMIATLVSFNNDPVRLAQQSIWLGMRHVKYGARAQHQQVIGQVVITTLERAVGDEWTAEMDKAWSDLWAVACRSMLDVTFAADKYGEVVRKMWADTRARTTCAKFGSNLRKMLLSGTEWVQGLSQGVDSKKDSDQNGSSTPGKRLRAPLLGGKGDDNARDDASVASSARKGSVNGEKASAAGSKENAAKSVKNEQTSEEKAKATSDADAVGSHFWEMLNVLMDYLWEPEQMNERLVCMTKCFFELGVRQLHLETIGNAICFSIERALADQWQPVMKDAWQWFWKMISDAMAAALDVLESGDVELIRAGWEEAKESRPSEELGDIFFKELARIAPHVTHLFKRPKRIQALQFINVVEMLLCFNEDPEQFFVDLKPLTIRHIKYGVKADYARAFGMTVLNGISQVLGDKFDERSKKAWGRLWTRVSSCVTRALNVGSNLVIVSLVQDDIDNFIEAMDCVPRGERFETLTKIDVNGEVVSPLDWSVMGGQATIAMWVIDDLCAIRADRNTYYYGRETMFETHPGLVAKICRQMPHLVDSLLNGLMWHASMVVDTRVRVNYYVRELYGVPAETVDTWTSTLGVLVQHGDPAIFNHPVVEMLLHMKWSRFGLILYLTIQVWYTIMLGLFTYGFAQLSDDCSTVATTIRQTVGGMSAVTLAVQTAVVGGQSHRGQFQASRLLGVKVKVPRFLANPWNSARFLSSMMLIVVTFSDECTFPAWGRRQGGAGMLVREEEELSWRTIMVAATSLFMWVQFMQVLVLSNAVAAFIYSVGRMARDVAINFTVIAVIVVAFGTCLNILRQPGGYADDIGSSMLNIVRVILGVGEPEQYHLDGWGLAALIIAIVMIAVCLINILVAQLVSSYGVLATNAEGFAKMNRAYICVEMESFLPMRYRLKCFDECGFDAPLEFDSSDEGPSGGIQVLCPSSIRTHPKYVPDRVIRFTGDASPMDPWPSNKVEDEEDAPNILKDEAPAVD
eukprot:CAMPEP_0172001742 /NCGR_PEP_ID=MMETSP1041-20130122/3034_1 /TAXON_ID=464988 /ORGANISM="Hemiselmis andersenii, Strain CCMP439" /LENGTH=1380 /DNA_ID=CAMNT_0012655407 /DNA_START=13 /DNA_END=4155 /DNA_ORIENTATION=+